MTILWKALTHYGATQADSLALVGAHEQDNVSWGDLAQTCEQLAEQLILAEIKVLALYAENSPAWVLVDLACQRAGIVLLPLPMFFSPEQIQHALTESGADAILTDQHAVLESLVTMQPVLQTMEYVGFSLFSLNTPSAKLPTETAKITFTSGSTGTPKGVCLSNDHQHGVASSLAVVIELDSPRHLCLLPLSTLLENIAGVYAPLLRGGTVIILPSNQLGFEGSSVCDSNMLISTIETQRPDSFILLPQLLLLLVSALEQGWQAPESLKFVAVGGAKVALSLLQRGHVLGLPVYEGYGLSECGSVVSLNTPEYNKQGSVGQLLQHVSVEECDGELRVSGACMLGYAGDEASWYQSVIETGDIAQVDGDGFLSILGRKKHCLISSFGRNIHPEWPESDALGGAVLQQCVVFGEAKPYCIALVLPREPTATDKTIAQWLESVNQGLPAYAQIKRWYRLETALTFENKLMTSNGRPIRNEIYKTYQSVIEDMYKEDVA